MIGGKRRFEAMEAIESLSLASQAVAEPINATMKFRFSGLENEDGIDLHSINELEIKLKRVAFAGEVKAYFL
jgi:hypothetical protein